MSASPVTVPPSQKRPLEEPSSDGGLADQHDAKRQALGNLKSEPDGQLPTNDQAVDGTIAKPEPIPEATLKVESQSDELTQNGDDTNGASAIPTMKHEEIETQPIQSMTSANGITSHGSPDLDKQVDETKWLHVRSIISGQEAATLIGKGGENVNLIRRMSGAKCTVSEYARGAVERVLTVSGQADHIAKAFGLIIRTLNQEDLEAASTAQSKTYPLRLLIPHILIGSIIGQKGVRIREIQDASGAKLNASDSCLPQSTERSLVVLGVADAVHIATYYIGSTLVEQLTEKFGGPAASAYATRGGKPAGVVPGGMQVVPYNPQSAGGQWGHPDSYQKHPSNQPGRQPANAYGVPFARGGQHSHYQHQQHHQQPQQQHGMQYGAAASPRPSYGGPSAQQAHGYPQQAQTPQHGYQGHPQQPMGGQPAALPGQPLTQQIFIPNDMVGAIIGKGGAKINEIRQLSGSVIKINEPQDNSNERLVTITGTQECNQMALYMLYQRLGQSQPNPTR